MVSSLVITFLCTPVARSCKMHLRLFENPASEPQIDLDTLSGPTEVSLEIAERSGVKYIAKFGVSIAPSLNSVVPSQTITIAPRHVVLNESEESITVRQCNLEVCTHQSRMQFSFMHFKFLLPFFFPFSTFGCEG